MNRFSKIESKTAFINAVIEHLELLKNNQYELARIEKDILLQDLRDAYLLLLSITPSDEDELDFLLDLGEDDGRKRIERFASDMIDPWDFEDDFEDDDWDDDWDDGKDEEDEEDFDGEAFMKEVEEEILKSEPVEIKEDAPESIETGNHVSDFTPEETIEVIEVEEEIEEEVEEEVEEEEMMLEEEIVDEEEFFEEEIAGTEEIDGEIENTDEGKVAEEEVIQREPEPKKSFKEPVLFPDDDFQPMGLFDPIEEEEETVETHATPAPASISNNQPSAPVEVRKQIFPDPKEDEPEEDIIEKLAAESDLDEIFGKKQPETQAQPTKRSLNDLLIEKKEDNSLNNRFQNTKIHDLAKSISINEKFLFIRELFSNRGEEFSKAVQELNNCTDIEEAFDHIDQLKKQYLWDSDSSAYLSFCDLVRRKY
ncbi:hypothetical protein LJC68_04705 [Bacteroidales bacterium OttesenSCG-928-B11]|nr:hypothetical protein [Bacteroidales bacterium OttesenSCG-928-E04]MDL2308762.1 hypothetical protein [Bacteroidales bacterium OttesenSCG-928-C03]MDL2312159.1 hypothetical protein [Bacteroidales bacterium OttesenSCG-928-B11]